MRNRLMSLAVGLLATMAISQETGYNTNWSGHRTLFVNTSNVSQTGTTISGNVLKYPMLVRLGQADSAIFAAAKATGADIRFTKSNNTTRLKHSIETWDSAGRVGALWVLLDTVYSNNLTQSFRMHWGNAAAADSSKSTAVFDTANGFVAVWQMADATNTLTDATANGFSGTVVGNANTNNPQITSVAGIIGKGQDFPASTANDNTGGAYRINGTKTGALNFPDSGVYTISTWAFPHSANQFRTVVGKGDNAWAFHSNSGTWEFFQYANTPPSGGAWQAVNLSGSAASNNWYNVVGIRNGGSSYLYLNGLLVDSTYTNATNAAARLDTADVHIGKWGGAAGTAQTSNDRFFDGVLDELRISKVVRSADWAALDFASQKAGQTLVTDSAAPMIAYTLDTLKVETGFPAQVIRPSVFTGVPHPTVAVSPALPAGLSLTTANTTDRGMISGTPTGTTSATTMHVITATNGKGTFSDTIYVKLTANSENYSTWSNIKTMTFTSPATTTVTQYPFLLRLGSADSAVFSGAGTGGASLRFSRTDAIKLKYAIEQWDAANKSAAIWVLMDQVTSGTNTLRMHWGNGSATSQSNPAGVFSRDNGHVGVWHMGDASGATPRPNSVQAGVNDAVPGGSATATMLPIPGVIGMADSLRQQGGTSGTKGTDDHFYLGNGIRFANYQMSMSMWINLPVTIATGWNHFMGFGNVAASDNVWFGRVGSNDNWKARGAANGAESNSDASLVVTNGLNPRPAWAHFAITRSGNLGRRWTMHKNGVQLIDFTGTANNHDLLTTVRDSNFIGRALWPDPNTRAAIDEARVDNVARSAAWYQLDYATQRPGAMPLSGLSYGTISGPPGTAITPRAPNVSAAQYSYTGTLPAGIAFNDTTGVISGTPTAPGASTITVTATSGVWSTSAPVLLSFGAVDGDYATAWSGHKYVSINATTAGVMSGTHLKFPLLVRLGTADSAIFNASQTNGADVRFTKLNNTTRLKHEIEHWDKAGRSAAVWVSVDTVYSATNGSRLRMHYGNANVADSSQPSAVFDTANGYLGVWHMGNVPDSLTPRPNAVAGGFPATPVASTANLPGGFKPIPGIIGRADTLRAQTNGTNATARGANDHFNLGNSGYVFTGGQVTMSMWAWFPGPDWPYTSYHHFLTFGNGTNAADNIWMGRIGSSNTFAQRSATSSGESSQMESPDALLPLGEWANFTITRSGTNGTTFTSFKNGAIILGPDVATTNPEINAVSRTLNFIGRSNWADANVRMRVDEVRVQKVARSAEWVKLEYANQNANQNLVALTDNLQNVVGIHEAMAMLNGPALSFKPAGRGLVFQVNASEASRQARISILDMQGRSVWSHAGSVRSGLNQVIWNGDSKTGSTLGSGIYVVRMSLVDANGKITHRLDRKVPLTTR